MQIPFRPVLVQCPGGNLVRNEEEQANAFAQHMQIRFTPYDFTTAEEASETNDSLRTPLQMALPITPARVEEIVDVISPY